MKMLMEAVRRSLESAGLYKAEARLLCGVSGGCDSVALVHALCEVRKDVSFTLFACHIQHGLRGENSDRDEQFVRTLCAALNVPLLVENAGLQGSMHDPGMETQARERRRTIFLRQMQQLQLDALLVAHHRDDQTETVMMHLLRGSGMEGLCGMKAASPFGCGLILRPFLHLPKEALKRTVSSYREDESNFEPLTPRNQLRLNILPQLESLYPGASAHIAQAAQRLSADEAFLSSEADRLYQSALYAVPPLFMLNRKPLCAAPEALTRRVLRRWWQEGRTLAGIEGAEQSLSHDDTERLVSLLSEKPGVSCNLPGGLAAHAGQAYLFLLRQSGEPLVCASSIDAHLQLTQEPAFGSLPKSAEEIILTPELLAMNPVFRPIQPDDRIHPFGAPGSKPLRRFLTDRKIDLPLRSALTVLACGSDVWWIPSLCVSEHLRLTHLPDGSVRFHGVHSFLSH